MMAPSWCGWWAWRAVAAPRSILSVFDGASPRCAFPCAGSRLLARVVFVDETAALGIAGVAAREGARVLLFEILDADVDAGELRAGADFVPLPPRRVLALRPFEFMELFPDVRAIVPDRFRIRKDEGSGLVIYELASCGCVFGLCSAPVHVRARVTA
jgi:hypothetical protein